MTLKSTEAILREINVRRRVPFGDDKRAVVDRLEDNLPCRVPLSTTNSAVN